MITGASGGIGVAIAKALHAQGATVGLHGTREERLQEIAAELGDRVHLFPANLSDADAVRALAAKAEADLGGIDILVNNAGITKDGLFVRMSDDDWDAVLDINLKSVFQLTRDAVYPMMRRKSGRIINITSIVGVTGNPGQGNYCASKAGMIGMSKSLAMEIASRKVTVKLCCARLHRNADDRCAERETAGRDLGYNSGQAPGYRCRSGQCCCLSGKR